DHHRPHRGVDRDPVHRAAGATLGISNALMGEPRTAFKPDDRHGLILYDYAGSPCARRVRITLIEKGLGWGTQVIDLSCLEQRNPEYLKLTPNGFVPTLAHGERVIYESNVITEYLDDVFPQPRLYPDDPWELAQVNTWQSAELAMAKDYLLPARDSSGAAARRARRRGRRPHRGCRRAPVLQGMAARHAERHAAFRHQRRAGEGHHPQEARCPRRAARRPSVPGR